MNLLAEARAALFAHKRRQFPALQTETGARVRLNNAAGTEMPEPAIEAMVSHLRTAFSNEGVIFARPCASAELGDHTRSATADLLGASREEIGFGASTTANIFSISRALARSWGPGDRILVSEACHEANISPWLALQSQGITVDFIPMLPDTHLDYAWLETHLDARTRLIAVAASSNSTGTLHDVQRVARLAKTVAALVVVDAAHFVPHAPTDVEALGADVLFFSCYKCFGPHLAAFYLRRSLCTEVLPFSPTPGDVQRTAAHFETGTRPFEAYAGWLGTLWYLEDLGRRTANLAGEPRPGRRKALLDAMRAIAGWEAELVAYADLKFSELSHLELYRQPAGKGGARLGVYSFNVQDMSPLEVAQKLDEAGIEAACGHQGSIRTMNRLATAQSGKCLRLSLAHYNTREDIDRAIECLASLHDACGRRIA